MSLVEVFVDDPGRGAGFFHLGDDPQLAQATRQRQVTLPLGPLGGSENSLANWTGRVLSILGNLIC